MGGGGGDTLRGLLGFRVKGLLLGLPIEGFYFKGFHHKGSYRVAFHLRVLLSGFYN